MSSISTRPPPKPVLLFALHAVALTLLLGLWPTPRALYPELLRTQAEWLFGGDRGDGPRVLLHESRSQQAPELDTVVEAVDPAQQTPLWRVRFSAVRMGYWPSAALLALLLATPLTARRRAWASVAGLLWLDAFALARIGLEIRRAFLELAQGEGVAGGWLLAARTGSEVLNSNIVVIASVLIGWVALASPRRTIDPTGLLRLLGVAPRRPPAASRPSP